MLSPVETLRRYYQPYNLDPQTMDYIVTGYHLGDDGIIE
jgi:hypothetical protein